MAEQATINLNVATDDSQKSLRAMRQELKQLQIAMDNAADPAEFKRLAAEFAGLRNDIIDTSETMKYLDPGELFSGWTEMAQGAVGAFSAITGAMSLFGDESEAIQEIEKKSMVLIQTMMGLEQARQLLIDGGGRKQIAQIIETTGLQIKQAAATAVQTVAQKGATLATNGSTVATRLLGKAMKSLPIMWLVAGLAAIVAGTVALVSVIKKETQAEHDRNIVIRSYNKLRQEAVSSTMEQVVKLEMYAKIAGDATKGEKERTTALKNLNETMGTSLTLTDDLTLATELYTASLIQQATADAVVKRIAEINTTLADGQKLVEESKGNWIEQGISWVRQSVGGVQGRAQDMVETSRRVASTTKDLKTEITGLTEELDVLMEQILNNQQAQEDAAAAAKKEAAAIAAGNAAWEKRQAAIKSVNDEYAKFLRDAAFNAETELGKIKFLYDEDVAKWKKNLDDKLISQEKYDNWYKIRTSQFHSDILKKEEELYGKVEEMKSKSVVKSSDEEIKLRTVTLDSNKGSYAEDVMNWDESNKTKLWLLREAYKEGTITAREYAEASITIYGEIAEKAGYVIDGVAGSLSSVFSNLTEAAQMELDAQDKAWNDSWEARYGKMDESMKRVAEIYGQDSMEYRQALKEKEDADKLKADHDALMEKRRKDADNKYKKGSIATDMAKATAEFAKASFGIWAGETSTKGLMGIPIALALQAMLAAAFGTQMGVMAKQMSLVGKMRLGGPVFGPSHESGGVSRELEGGEFVINAQSMKVPGVAQLANSLNRTGQGGSAPVMAALPDESIERIVGAIAAIPVVVSERDITGTQRRVAVIESKTSF